MGALAGPAKEEPVLRVCAFSSQFLLLWHSLGFWVSGSVRRFRIGFHRKIGYRDERKGAMPKKEGDWQ